MRSNWGYGDLQAPIWFIGMEEGGEHTPEAFNALLDEWAQNGRPNVRDICPGNKSTLNPWFNTDRPRIQRTWGKLIRATLTAKERKVTLEAIRHYQRFDFARPSGETCLLELMPLPAPNISTWPYADQSDLPSLASRKEYLREWLPYRTNALANLIKTYCPKIVVFYSLQYFTHWQAVTGKYFSWTQVDFGFNTQWQTTRFFCTKHPTGFGVTNASFDQLGEAMRTGLR